ncbi:MAG: hypothetical protein LRY73_07960 [Bacillus sp. (in: Bacteria)]|nr:hypothetical protein [Bacillus sp. (in: firmicutes)]
MEKAMFQSHGISYAEYNRSIDNIMEVEKQREKDHKRSISIVAEHQQNKG